MKFWHDYRALEFAAVNPGFWGQKYRFAYGLGFPTGYLVIFISHISLIHDYIDVEKLVFSSHCSHFLFCS